MAHWIANPVCFLNPVIPRPGPATGLKPSRVLVFGEANSVLRWLVPPLTRISPSWGRRVISYIIRVGVEFRIHGGVCSPEEAVRVPA